MKTLALEDISVQFGSLHALSKVNIEVSAGEILMLIGPNGAGKSTLNKVLLGLVSVNAGQLRIDGVLRKVDNSVKERLGYLPEAVAFSENLSGRQVLLFFARARNISKKRVDEVLARVSLEHAARRPVRGYSRGMRQRLGLAVSILANPDFLVLDEPTGGLDQEGLKVLWSILAEWRDKGRMILMSTHDMALLERHVDRVCVLRSGQVLACGTPDELRQSAGISHKVMMHFAGDEASEQAIALTEALEKWGKGILTQPSTSSEARTEGRVATGTSRPTQLSLSVPDRDLLEFLTLQGQFPGALRRIRIEEPTLDVVYEKLLEEG